MYLYTQHSESFLSCVLIFQFIFVFQIVQYKPLKYGSSYEYPTWAEIVGVCLSLSSMVWIPGYALYYVIITPGSFKEVNVTMFACKLHAYELYLKLLSYIQ